MPDKNEIERRKQIAKELRLNARREFEKSIPMTHENFKSLFDYLNEQLYDNFCDHSLKLTIGYLQSLKLNNIGEITEWLEENGGNCDCEVLATIEEKFDRNAIL